MSDEKDLKLVRNFLSLIIKLKPQKEKAEFFYNSILTFEKHIKDDKMIHSLIEKLGLCGDRNFFKPLKDWLEEDSWFGRKKDLDKKVAILKSLYFLGNDQEKEELFSSYSNHPVLQPVYRVLVEAQFPPAASANEAAYLAQHWPDFWLA